MEHPCFHPEYPAETVKVRQWRQRQATLLEHQRRKEEDERGLEAAARKCELKRAEKEREVIRARAQAEWKEKCKRENKIYMEEKARLEAAEREEEERRRREREEQQRRQREAAERDRLAKMPWTCGTCQGSGRCIQCGGSGLFDSTFLAPQVDSNGRLEFGRKPQGCAACCGFGSGIRGRMQPGTGQCDSCDGHGMIWPQLVQDKAPHRRAAGDSNRDSRKSSHSSVVATS
uniref:Uncharacterized protein n=1 Tax=Pyrodinium bahamense TaxID=73915 RepID=A0A6T8RLA5_9DINO